ncbi:hypothetical protein TVAG_087380 [Trichomonas vaginalis G3]|uniref:Uncharacterized protein n=1 Tax=Trichomonas vaginalis (strain ATCC PRA-98 / G3) TaxID=412133 RepID=A2G5S7_TRIV3|nr:hypothetical protein TVAGG3_0873990 [Trichomonas vaginalis G3]EAX87495.1 hypothetical protein TVAG_087380 [Trichomonas vaginalis G3]KAI5501561.1 hypothetical protein TVAGG3_0873990 [Trichomonas vaginalis G3]|eukprot:XP_001300425.1 hypothetical protein [Trichomonas vaginalis G3]
MRGRRTSKITGGNSRLPDDDYKPSETRCIQDASFLEVVHPIEATGKINNKELTPIQKAITFCIMEHGGSASEQEILDFVTKKWKLINEKSIRQFQVKPCMRLIRLNLSIKKNNQQLFLPDPDKAGNMILGQYDPNASKHNDQTPESTDTIINESSSEELNQYAIETDFIEELMNYLNRSKYPVKFTDIVSFAKLSNFKINLFARLEFNRQIRAILVSLKVQGHLFYNPFDDSWCVNPILCQK